MGSFQPAVIDLSASAVQVVQTSRVNPRVIMDKNGLRAYDAAGNIVFNIDATTGNITLTGTATISGAVKAHGFSFYDDLRGFVWKLASTAPASQPFWQLSGPTWAQVKSVFATWGAMKAQGTWAQVRNYVIKQLGL